MAGFGGLLLLIPVQVIQKTCYGKGCQAASQSGSCISLAPAFLHIVQWTKSDYPLEFLPPQFIIATVMKRVSRHLNGVNSHTVFGRLELEARAGVL